MTESALNKATVPNPSDVTHGLTVTPRVDILETEQELLVIADMPGVQHEHVDVRFEKGELTFHGRRPVAVPERGYDRREIDAGDYFRSFRISEKIDSEKIWAEMKVGVLTLHLPKSEKAKPRKIAVKAG